MKNKDTALYCTCCRNTIPAVSLPLSLSLCFLHDIVFGTQTLWIHVFVQYVMFGSDWGRHSKSCCKTPLASMAVSTLDKYRVGLQLLLSQQVCEMCFVIYYQEQKKKWWENVIFTIHVLSRLTALLTWAASLGWTSDVTCSNIYREYDAPVVFTLSYDTYIDFARPTTQFIFRMKCNQIQFSY